MSHIRELTPKQKALEINLERKIYGTFAEIGAGQETVRFFYRAGGASGTLAKAMSAYDKDFSDAIYGREDDGRYVTEERLTKMLDHEMKLMIQRLDKEQHAGKAFFCYANTVTTIDYAKKYKGHGWVGLRFQASANEAYNDIILHVRFNENSAQLQQETLGVLGVNLIYGAYHFTDNPRELMESLYDSLDKDQIEIDMINFSGPRFQYVDNRLMSLQLLRHGMTQAVMFGPDGYNVLPADLLYRKNIFAVRGSFRPVTNVNIDMQETGLEMFKRDNPEISDENMQVVFEITLTNLKLEGEIDERDFLNRADILCHLGYHVLISNFQEYYKLIDYFSEYTRNRTQIGLTMGVNNLLDVFKEEYYSDLSGGIMEAFGKLFKRNVKVYLYPYLDTDSGELLNSNNLKVSDHLKELYKYFKHNNRIEDIENFNPEYLKIHSRQILKLISDCKTGWEDKLPQDVASMILERGLFGYDAEKCKFIQ
ncbi:MAG: TonB-dependent receptor [Flavobacteriaceae bacterium]|nr:TonB-dependent receptor [Flavobacteriaceae bacterium]